MASHWKVGHTGRVFCAVTTIASALAASKHKNPIFKVAKFPQQVATEVEMDQSRSFVKKFLTNLCQNVKIQRQIHSHELSKWCLSYAIKSKVHMKAGSLRKLSP